MSRFRKRHTEVGARPGTLMIPPNAAPPRINVMRYDADGFEEKQIARVEELAPYLKKPGVAWIDVQGIGDESVLRALAEMFSMHRLVLEDIVNVPQRPKVENYEQQLFIIARMIHVISPTNFDTEQLSLFVSSNFVVTFQEFPGDDFEPVRRRIRDGKGVIRKHGTDYLAYALLDMVIDAYYPVLEQVGDYLELLEDEVIQNPKQSSLKRIYQVKRELLTLRRSIWPHREAVNALTRDDNELLGETVRLYFRDTYDHCVQLIDGTETYRELVAGLMDVYLSSVANQQNEVMKVLTIMATIFIPLTFLAGLYGMNFEHMPELHYRWSYPAIMTVMAAMGIGMVLYFKRLGWIGRPREEDDDAEDQDTPK